MTMRDVSSEQDEEILRWLRERFRRSRPAALAPAPSTTSRSSQPMPGAGPYREPARRTRRDIAEQAAAFHREKTALIARIRRTEDEIERMRVHQEGGAVARVRAYARAAIEKLEWSLRQDRSRLEAVRARLDQLRSELAATRG